MPSTLSPFQVIQRNFTELKKNVDSLYKECVKHRSSKKRRSPEVLQGLWRRSLEYQTRLNELKGELISLTPDDVPKLNNFDKRKNDELKKFDFLQKTLEGVMSLRPEKLEEEDIAKLKMLGYNIECEEEKDSDDDNEGIEEVNEDENVEENVEEAEGQRNKLEDAEKLSQSAMEKETDETENADLNNDNNDESEETPKEVDNDEKDESEGKSENFEDDPLPTLGHYVAIKSFEGEENEDLPINEGDVLSVLEMDEDWWLCRKENGQEGDVHKSYLEVYDKNKTLEESNAEEKLDPEPEVIQAEKKPQSSAKLHWKKLKTELLKPAEEDILQALGTVPSGFRQTTLGKMWAENAHFRMEGFLTPKLSASNVAYRDIIFDPKTNSILPRSASLSKIIKLISCKNIPLPYHEAVVTNRFARCCLFDGDKFHSNIVLVHCNIVDKQQKNWMFSRKPAEVCGVWECPDLFVQVAEAVPNLGILVELGVTFRKASSDVVSEMSCGWVHVPFFNNQGTILPMKNGEVSVNGGTPFEKSLELDETVLEKENLTFRKWLAASKVSKLVMRVMAPRQDHLDMMRVMPDLILGNLAFLPFYAYYRHFLCITLLGGKLDSRRVVNVFHPFLANFPTIADAEDILDLIRVLMKEKVRSLRSSEKHWNSDCVRKLFSDLFAKFAYPLSSLVTLPKLQPQYQENIKMRKEVITEWWSSLIDKESALENLLSANYEYSPFDISEMSMNVVGPYCIADCA